MEYICKYCGKVCKNTNSLKQHEIRCKLNKNRIDMSYVNDIRPAKGHKGTNHFIKAKELGLCVPSVSDETRAKISAKAQLRRHSEESKLLIKQSMQRAVKEHPESYSAANVNGRVKKIEYNGEILDGGWELLVAQYLDSNDIKWQRPLSGFEYFWDNSTHTYYPDFYLPDYDSYIEVKGYERNRDLCKWAVVPKLIVIKRQEIKQIQEGTYILPISK